MDQEGRAEDYSYHNSSPSSEGRCIIGWVMVGIAANSGQRLEDDENLRPVPDLLPVLEIPDAFDADV